MCNLRIVEGQQYIRQMEVFGPQLPPYHLLSTALFGKVEARLVVR